MYLGEEFPTFTRTAVRLPSGSLRVQEDPKGEGILLLMIYITSQNLPAQHALP